MSVIVFVGPTLPVALAREIFVAEYLPPARAGDVLAAARRRPAAIAIIDGLFEAVPAVWHKEILYALSEGIPVYGASSMGALRAAELHSFGMIGVGEVFAAYASGALEDDDEVAVVHAPVSDGSRVLSDAMVNIREGLKLARADGLIGADTHDRMITAAKGLYYGDRSWRAAERVARADGAAPEELTKLLGFVRASSPDRKRQDAILLLRRLAEDAARGFVPFVPEFRLERSIFFERFMEADLRVGAEDRAGVTQEAAVRRAKLVRAEQGVLYDGLLRSLVLAEGARLGIAPSAAELAQQEALLRDRHEIDDDAAFEHWLLANRTTRTGLDELLKIAAITARLINDHGALLDRFVAMGLRVEGRFAALTTGLEQEQALLREVGLEQPTLESAGTTVHEVLGWYQDHLRPIVGSLETHARGLGFAGGLDLLRELTTLFVAERLRR